MFLVLQLDIDLCPFAPTIRNTIMSLQLGAASVFDFQILFQVYFPTDSLTGKAGSASEASLETFAGVTFFSKGMLIIQPTILVSITAKHICSDPSAIVQDLINFVNSTLHCIIIS